jgi:hypothetical protein
MELGLGARIGYAFRCFFVLLFKGRLPYDVLDRFRPEAAPAVAPAPSRAVDTPADRAVQLLGILQRDGRLVDFLQESLDGYADAQIGAAVRDVHANCRNALARYLSLEPLLAENEGDRVRIQADTDPARVKVVGVISSTPSLQGVVRHRGWRVTEATLPPLGPEGARDVVAPGEIEVA